MSSKKMPKLQIGNLEIAVPIIQGGMGVGISLSNLASAVANEGGVGVIASVGIGAFEPSIKANYVETHKNALRREIKKARKMTKGIIGVNIMVALTDFNEHVEGAVEENADIILLGAGLPLRLPMNRFKESNTKFVVIVSSGRAAKLIFKYWKKNYDCIPDAVVVEGPLAGGHLGFKKEEITNPNYALENLIPDVISQIKPYEKDFDKIVPVIAAGGIYTGADIHKFLQLGAQGVQMATRFVTTHECDASIEFKKTYIKCKKEDIVIINSPVGLPGRAIKNEFLKKVLDGIRIPFKCPWKCLKTCDVINSPYCIAEALVKAKIGAFEGGFAFAGANAYIAEKIISVKEVFENLTKEYELAVA